VMNKFADVAQEDVIRAASLGERFSYKFSCGHVVGEGMARTSLSAIADDDVIIQRTPRLAESVHQYAQNVENLPLDMCPVCLTKSLSQIFRTTLT